MGALLSNRPGEEIFFISSQKFVKRVRTSGLYEQPYEDFVGLMGNTQSFSLAWHNSTLNPHTFFSGCITLIPSTSLQCMKFADYVSKMGSTWSLLQPLSVNRF